MAMRNRKLPSVTNRFSEVPSVSIPRSRFKRDHGLKTTFDAGYLVPILVDEAVPGDTFSVQLHGIVRLLTPLVPFMDNMTLETQFFAIPKRLLWDNFKRFNGEQDNPDDPIDFLVPHTVVDTPYAIGSLQDYMGLPTGVTGYEHSALPLRAYNLTWNQWYRDQNLQDSIEVPVGDGPDLSTTYTLQRRGKRHDYFTSSLPWPQKGEAVSLPLGETAPVVPEVLGQSAPSWGGSGGGGPTALAGNGSQEVSWNAGGLNGVAQWADPALVTDLSEATAATINSLRQAFQLQRLLERDARGGTRYTEIVRSHFGVISPDARLQRPEYLGGGRSPIYINPVANTAGDPQGAENARVGDLAAVATAMVDGHGFTQGFTEHCIILGLASVRADLTYQQGLERMWSRKTRYDFFWPALSHIGEQAVLSKEIYCDGTAADEDVWGYQERYAEYRYKPSRITGLFRSTAPQSLDAWHLAQDFTTRPVLSEEFIVDNPPVDRVVAIQDEPHFKGDFYFSMSCTRPMPMYGTPGYIDHF